MYWLENSSGRYWYQSPIETQALIIEAFAEITKDQQSIDALKVWLIRNKQRNNWPTTKSTTEAIYSLLLTGTDVLSVRDNTVFVIGDDKIVSRKLAENEKEAQTGYVKMKWTGAEVTKDLARLTIQNKSDVPGYGGFYWQYFENLDKIQGSTQADLSVSKQLFINDIGSSTLKILQPGQKLKVGQKLTVRLTVVARENAEFVHLKDMRASCFEPEFVKSEYKWGSDIGYYMSTRDTATHFFFDEINKGTYILEYNIRVNNNGDFSNGVTTIQSMYAPEFASHTEGIRVSVGE